MKPAAWIGTGAGILLLGGVLFWSAGKFARQEVARTQTLSQQPKVTSIEPADEAAEVSPVTGVKAGVSIPSGAGVDEKTLDAGVSLVRVKDGQTIPANLNTSGAGDDIVLVPRQPLELGTQYRFAVSDGLKDTAGTPFQPRSITFTTAKSFAVSEFPAAFEKVELKNASLERDAFTSLAFGPDGLLYAGTFAGMIHRYSVNEDGTLSERAPVKTILKENRGPRLITGITFDPQATADEPILWVSHGQFAMKEGRPEGAEDWTGKISRLRKAYSSGPYIVGTEPPVPNLDAYEDVITGLPRAYKDHLNFQLAFAPDGSLFFNQGSNTSVGDVDVKWGYRKERKLTAAVLRVDGKWLNIPPPLEGGGRGRGPEVPATTNRAAEAKTPADPSPNPLPQGEGEKNVASAWPLNVKTEDGGIYDPTASGAPLTLYATGVRSGFRLLFHRNGHLYTGVNGAAGNEGNTPASPDGTVPSIRDIKQTTDDMLLKIEPGAYYGHPNPSRGQYVLNGGNPTAGVDPMEVPAYPVGTKPDPAWKPPAYDFGKNYSPNGLIDYKAVNGTASELDGCILVTRYSDGKDILVLKLNKDGDVVETIAGLDGFTGLNAPLDLIEDPKSGNIYVAEYRGQRITLLKPIPNGNSAKAQRTTVKPGS